MIKNAPQTRPIRLAAAICILAGANSVDAAAPEETVSAAHIERVTTVAPFPRGLAMVDGTLYVLCRGRVRAAGGVTAEVNDRAGTIYAVDPNVSEPLCRGTVNVAIRSNGTVFARPTSPTFRLWDRTANPPEADRQTDRPYCTLRYHEPTASFYLCAFSGIDKHRTAADPIAFSKNRSDAVLRFDTRTNSWHEVERHDANAGDQYPNPDSETDGSFRGLLNGPDNCLAVGDWLYVASKDNSLLVRYDLSALTGDPHAGPPQGEIVLAETVTVDGQGDMQLRGQSALAWRDGWLYVAYRTTSEIIRIRVDKRGEPTRPIVAQLVARFDPYDPITHDSANITDMDFDDAGRLYVVSARPARIFRFEPDPNHVYDARDTQARPWADLAAITHNPKMKSENVLYHDGWLYVTSGDGYDYQAGADGTVYRVKIES